MGLFDSAISNYNQSTTSEVNMTEFMEMCIVDEVSKLSDEQIQEFCKPGGMGEALVEAGKLRKKTLVRLSKNDDLERRQGMAVLQIAKEKGDPIYDKLIKNRIKEKEYLAILNKKYGQLATKAAKGGQKEFLKKNIPGFLRGGNTDSVR